MKHRFRLMIILLISCLLVSCVGNQRQVRSGRKHTHGHQAQRNQNLSRHVNQLLEKKQYREALEAVTDPKEPNEPLPGMEREYVAAVNGLLAVGKEALSLNNYPFAGRSFRAILDAYPKDKHLRGRLKTTARRIRIYLDTCSCRLMEQGLQEYRRGELDRAIITWKSLTAFNTEHADARKAIETAGLQKKTLETLSK